MDHPFIPTNDMNKILAHQERYRVANIIDIHQKGDDFFAVIQVNPKFAHLNLPAFCSPAIYQLDASEHETQISKWSALHLAGLDEDPAYGARIALLRGTCTGGMECIHQLKTAKQHQIVNPNEPGGRFNPKTPLRKEVPFGPEKRTKRKLSEDAMSRFTQGFDELATGEKIRPKKPTQADKQRIISASRKLARITSEEIPDAGKVSEMLVKNISSGGIEAKGPLKIKKIIPIKENEERIFKNRARASEAGFEGIEEDRKTEDRPLFSELKQRGLIKKMSKLRLRLAQGLLPKRLSGQDIVNKFQKVKGSIPKNKGFTFVPETGALIDVTEGRDAGMLLRAELKSPKGMDTFLESNTRDIKNEKDLVPFLDKIEGTRLIGGFVDDKGNFEFDATTTVQGGSKSQSIKRLQKEKQKSGIRIGPEGEHEFFDAGKMSKPKLASVIVKERQPGNNMFSNPKGEKTAEQNQRQLDLQRGDSMVECTPCEVREINELKAKAKLNKMAAAHKDDDEEEESY